MTDQQWQESIAEIESLHYQLVNNIMPLPDRRDMQAQLADRLQDVAHHYREQALKSI